MLTLSGSQVSTYSPAYLNRQAILLMDALGTKQVRLTPCIFCVGLC